MFYQRTKNYPIADDTSASNNNLRWTICLTVFALCTCTATMVFFVYHNHYFGLGLNCPKKSMFFQTDTANVDKLLFDYATFWANRAKHGKRFTVFLNTSPDDDPDELFDGLVETFEPLSLRPCPIFCRKPKKKKKYFRHSRTKAPLVADYEVSYQGLPLAPIFEMNLSSEFKFRDDVLAEAQEMMATMENIANDDFHQIVSVYLTTLTHDVESKISGNGLKNVRESQHVMLQSTMDYYRATSNPLFIFLGNLSEAEGLNGKDVFKQPNVPENVALAVLSLSNYTIFNHGLWPTFGAVLAKSNVNSFAMDKTLLDAANNASLNWTTTVTY